MILARMRDRSLRTHSSSPRTASLNFEAAAIRAVSFAMVICSIWLGCRQAVRLHQALKVHSGTRS